VWPNDKKFSLRIWNKINIKVGKPIIIPTKLKKDRKVKIITKLIANGLLNLADEQ
jgi:hypothetical protein